MQGKVKWFGSKGYGFISDADGKDYFVHHSAINAEGYRSLNVGDIVEFDVAEDPKGLRAANVTRTEAAVPGLVTKE